MRAALYLKILFSDLRSPIPIQRLKSLIFLTCATRQSDFFLTGRISLDRVDVPVAATIQDVVAIAARNKVVARACGAAGQRDVGGCRR